MKIISPDSQVVAEARVGCHGFIDKRKSLIKKETFEIHVLDLFLIHKLFDFN